MTKINTNAKAKKSGMQVGDIRDKLAADHKLMIEKAMTNNNHKFDKPYYILAIAKNEDGDIKSFAFVMAIRPPVDLINSMLYKVEPKSGKYEMVYVKPRDMDSGGIIFDKNRSGIQDLIATNNMKSFTPLMH